MIIPSPDGGTGAGAVVRVVVPACGCAGSLGAGWAGCTVIAAGDVDVLGAGVDSTEPEAPPERSTIFSSK